jgi:hypothetical protein
VTVKGLGRNNPLGDRLARVPELAVFAGDFCVTGRLPLVEGFEPFARDHQIERASLGQDRLFRLSRQGAEFLKPEKRAHI